MLQPFGEEGCLTNENAGFPFTTKQHVEAGYSTNEYAGFQLQENHMFLKHDTMLTKHYLFIVPSNNLSFHFS